MNPIIALQEINTYFSEDYLENDDLITICNENLLKPLINKLIPDQTNMDGLRRFSDNHRVWHNEFKYKSHINEQIL